jgi:hypothetical protein
LALTFFSVDISVFRNRPILAFLALFGGQNRLAASANASARQKWEDGQGETPSAFDDFDQNLGLFAQKWVPIWGVLALCKKRDLRFFGVAVSAVFA